MNNSVMKLKRCFMMVLASKLAQFFYSIMTSFLRDKRKFLLGKCGRNVDKSILLEFYKNPQLRVPTSRTLISSKAPNIDGIECRGQFSVCVVESSVSAI